MEDMNRRSAMTIGLVAAAVPLISLATPAKAAMYGPQDGKEVMPGIRQVELGEFPIAFGGYGKMRLNDYIYAPGVVEPSSAMMNDMICQIMEGELLTKLGDNDWSPSKTGFLFACAKDALEENKNETDADAVMRVIDLLPA